MIVVGACLVVLSFQITNLCSLAPSYLLFWYKFIRYRMLCMYSWVYLTKENTKFSRLVQDFLFEYRSELWVKNLTKGIPAWPLWYSWYSPSGRRRCRANQEPTHRVSWWKTRSVYKMPKPCSLQTKDSLRFESNDFWKSRKQRNIFEEQWWASSIIALSMKTWSMVWCSMQNLTCPLALRCLCSSLSDSHKQRTVAF